MPDGKNATVGAAAEEIHMAESIRGSVESAGLTEGTGFRVHRIPELNEAVAEPTRGLQLERYVSSPWLDERDSFADEDWNHVNDELVDLAGVEK